MEPILQSATGTETPETQKSTDGLIRGLTLVAATSLVVGGVVGSGIFLVPSIVARQVGTPWLSLTVWIVAGFLATCGALCYAELGAALPVTGGNYAFLRQSFSSRIVGFFFGWSLFLAVAPAIIAAVATAFALYAGFFLGHVLPYGPATVKLVAITAILLLSVTNYVGVRVGGRIQTTLTMLKVTALALLVGIGSLLGKGSFSHLSAQSGVAVGSGSHLAAIGTAMISALFAYEGWTYSTFVAGEIERPRRNVPLSIIVGMGIVLAVYLAVNLVYMYVLPFQDLQTSTLVAADTMKAVIGRLGGAFIALAVVISTFGTINAQLLSFPRAFYAMSRDGLFFSRLGKTHNRYKTPSAAIALEGLMAAAFAASGSYEDILKYASFVEYLFTCLTVVGLIVLRFRAPDLHRPSRVWGYPFTPLLFLAITTWYLLNTLIHSFKPSLVGILLTLSGLPFYLYWHNKSRPTPDSVSV